jgi:hypothetical protein
MTAKMFDRRGVEVKPILLGVCFFTMLLGMIPAFSISWTKYRIEGSSVEPTCFSKDVEFVADGVPDSFACSKMCYLNNKCPSTFFQPESHRCIGCQVFLKGAPLQTSTGSVQYSHRGKWERTFSFICIAMACFYAKADCFIKRIALMNCSLSYLLFYVTDFCLKHRLLWGFFIWVRVIEGFGKKSKIPLWFQTTTLIVKTFWREMRVPKMAYIR